jgi:tetratricopeptide (TPR) repeat protein
MSLFDRLKSRFKSLTGWRTPAILDEINKATIRLGAQRRFEEYLAHCERAIDLARSYYGDDSPRLVLWYNKSAIPNKALGRFAEAEKCYRRALDICTAAWGDSHPRAGECLVNLAQLHHQMGENTSAVPTFQRALAIFRSAREDGDEVDVVPCLCGLARVQLEREDFTEAESLLREARALVQVAQSKGDGLTPCLFSMELMGLAVLYAAKEQPMAAEPLWREVLDLPSDDVEGVAKSLVILARIYLGLNQA